MPDKWNTIEYPHGPYIPALYPPDNYGTAVLIDKNSDDLYELTPEEQEVAMLFASKLVNEDSAKIIMNDKTYTKNFWNTFNHPPDMEFKDVDWSDVIDHVVSKQAEEDSASIKEIRKRRYTYGKIIVNGKDQLLDVYSVPPISIHYGSSKDPHRGKVKRGILPKDIVLNLSLDLDPPHPEYDWRGVVEHRDELWVVQWNDPVTGSLNYIEIQQPEGDIEEEELPPEMYDDEGEELEIIGYDENEDEDDIEDVDDRYLVYGSQKQELVEPEDDIDLSELTEAEAYLPLAFLLGKLDQWTIMKRACNSGFRVVDEMHKVVDKQLKTFVDAAVYAVREKGIRSPMHNAIIKYGEQRKLF